VRGSGAGAASGGGARQWSLADDAPPDWSEMALFAGMAGPEGGAWGNLPVFRCRGVAFVGDAHVWSQRPGLRNDADYAAAVLGELEAALGIAADRKCAVVLLGDLLHRPVETEESIKFRLQNLFRRYRRLVPIFANAGNHEMSGARLAPTDTLAVLASSGNLAVRDRSGPVAVLELSAGDDAPGGGPAPWRLGLGMTPYGQAIPEDVSGDFPPDVAGAVWATHHDLAIGGAYPGARPLHPIRGCALVVNGHMHKAAAPAMAADTMWFNPGSLTRVAVDEAAHEPHVWILDPGTGGLAPVPVPHRRDVFDLTGRLVAAAAPGAGGRRAAGEPLGESEFAAALLEDDDGHDPAARDEATVLLAEIRRRLDAEGASDALREAVLGLFHAAAGTGGAGGRTPGPGR